MEFRDSFLCQRLFLENVRVTFSVDEILYRYYNFPMAYILLILLGSIWGASYLFIKLGGESVPPVTLVAMRTVFAGITLIIVLWLRREKIPSFRAPIWKWFLLLGFLNSVIPYTLITWGETRISSGLTAILVGTMPIFTVLFAHWMTHDEKITPRKMIGILMGFVGVVVLFIPDVLGAATSNLFGGIAVVAAAVSYALATIYARRHLKGHPPALNSFGQMLMASIILVPASLIIDRPWTLSPTPISMASILALAVLGTAIAYLMYFWLIANVGATRTSLVTYISPVIAVILGAVVLNEHLNWSMVVGLGLVVAGVGLVTNLQLRGRAQTREMVSPSSLAE